MRLLFIPTLVTVLLITSFLSASEPFLLKDINPSGESNPVWLTDVNGILFFQADDGTNGQELWQSNGTPAGTVMVKDIYPGSAGSEPEELINVNGTLFFRATGTYDELWKSDGTEEGTIMVKNMPYGDWSPMNLTDVNGTLFFTDYYYGGLWKSDGTEAGTIMIPPVYDIYPENLTNINGTLFFCTDIGTSSDGLWKSDGTEAGTVIVYPSIKAANLTNLNGTLFFKGYSGSDYELWKSDGTEAGTILVKDIYPGSKSSNPSNLTSINGVLFFAADNGAANGRELWKSDGNEAGTVMIKDVNPGSPSSYPSDLININGTLFFSACDANTGYELWKSDGNEAGTVLVKDINPGSASSNPSYLIYFNGTLFFTADNGINGYELWKSDGTEAGTCLAGDIYPGAASSWPKFLTNVSSNLFFSTNYELWMLRQIDSNNNECPNSVQIVSDQTVYGSNASATGTDLTTCAYNDTADVWFYFKPAVTSGYTINVRSDEFDTTLAVFNACGGSQLACNDDYLTTDSQIVLNMIKGKRYYIRVAGFDGQTGNFELSVSTGYCAEYAAGDLNGDCKVNMQDFAILASEWMTGDSLP